MSKKHPKGAILGPDGKVLPPSPKPPGTALMVSTAGGPRGLGDSWFTPPYGKSIMQKYMASYLGMDLSSVSFGRPEKGGPDDPTRPKPDPYAALDPLLVTLDDMESGVKELPEGTIDRTKYADAFYLAAKSCQHSNYEDTMYAKREAKCLDCGKYFKRQDRW